jgi:putative ABC transport system permease protein
MLLEHWRQDLFVAGRGLRRAKGFAGAAVLTLALGITATTVMFALIKGVLLRPLPVREQEKLLVAWKELPASAFGHYPFRVPELEGLRAHSRLLESVAGVDYNGAWPYLAVENDSATFLQCVSVMGDFFGTLGVEPILGRALDRADDRDGAENVLVISHGLWQRRYGGAREVLDRMLTLRERPFRIVGVMPPGFEYPRGSEVWITLAALRSTVTSKEFVPYVDIVTRVRHGATIEQVESELHGLMARLEAEAPPGAARGFTPVVRSYEDAVVGEVRRAMLVLFGAVGLVLVITCANVANLLLMRGEARRPEMAMRAALGASRTRLARQVLAESAVLAFVAGALGLGLSWWSLPALIALVPAEIPRVESIRIDGGVLVFTIALAFVTATLAGLAPALSSARTDPAVQLRAGGRGSTRPATSRGRRALVAAQVALAVTVVAAVGLLTRTLLQLQTVDMGLAADRLVVAQLALPPAKYAEPGRQLQFLEDVVAALDVAPGIDGATPVNTPPFAGTAGWDAPTFTAEGQSADRAATNSSLNLESIHPNYFSTFGVVLLRGRAFTHRDRQGAPNVVIVSEDVAARTWPGEDAIGKRVKLGGADSRDPWREVVGVARRTRYRELRDPRATLYLPASQFMFSPDMIVLRTASLTDAVAALVRDRIRTVDPAVEVMRVARFAELLEGPLARPRFNVFLIGVFAVAAWLLAAIGLYGLMGASVRQRYTEIGIRVALGATASDVRRLVVGEGLRLAGLGAAIGLVGAAAASRLLRALLFEVHWLDPASMVAAALLLVGGSALASYLPARRATSVDPVIVLRAS